jgi:nitroreductase
MDFQELVRARYSVRAYKPDTVEEEKLAAVLEAARLAPTAANRQAFRLYVIPTRGREQELARVYGREWFVQPPLVIAIAGVPAKNWVRRDGRNYVDVDCAIVMDHLILQAADLGLGTCWVGAFDPAAAREVLQLPADWEPIAFTPLGYAADSPRPKKRVPLDDVVIRLR